MIGITLRDNQQAVFGPITGVSARGNPAPLENIRYTIQAGSETYIAWEERAPNWVLKSLGPLTPAGAPSRAFITADVDLDEGEVKDVQEMIDVEVLAGEAATLAVGAPTIEDQQL